MSDPRDIPTGREVITLKKVSPEISPNSSLSSPSPLTSPQLAMFREVSISDEQKDTDSQGRDEVPLGRNKSAGSLTIGAEIEDIKDKKYIERKLKESEKNLKEIRERAADWGLACGSIRNDVEALCDEVEELREELQSILEANASLAHSECEARNRIEELEMEIKVLSRALSEASGDGLCAVPLEEYTCEQNQLSSRMCEKGTKCCVIKHD